MKEITRIVIKGSSGYVPADYAYHDKLTITPEAIAYEYKPWVESPENPARNWRYTSDSPEFRAQFAEVAAGIREALEFSSDIEILDVGTVEFTVTYSDKTKETAQFSLIGDWSHDLFMDIKMMVPFTEMIPPTLWTEEDEEEDE